jgi:hypothetical protein
VIASTVFLYLLSLLKYRIKKNTIHISPNIDIKNIKSFIFIIGGSMEKKNINPPDNNK